METSIKGAIFYLTQNNDVRRTHLKTSLYFLFRNFNSKYKYPVLIFHEGDYDLASQEDVLMSVRASCRSCVNFHTLDKEDFEIPAHIDKDRLRSIIALKPVPYWRNDKYRLMCRWWVKHMHKYTQNYEYVMRMDDDSYIEEPIQKDLFEFMKEKKALYASNIVHTDCALCCYGMKEFFEKKFPGKEHADFFKQAFLQSKIPTRAIQFHTFRSVLSINKAVSEPIGDELVAWSPIMYYNNFFITDTAFWRRDDVQELIDEIDKNGSIFYYRWGDAPLHTIIVSLLGGVDRIERVKFKYSKRMQREAFHGDDGQLHCYMPAEYELSSCVSESMKLS